jgi:class 3 adenylate cyclase
MEVHGDDAALAVVANVHAELRAASERCGVQINKWLGDGAMLSGFDPGAVTRCAAQALVQVAVSSPLPLRGGVARGFAHLRQEG